jgi:5-formyltetrahydrofolate cyclo-ligase
VNEFISEKRALRERLRSLRAALPPEQRDTEHRQVEAAVRRLPEWQTARRWFVYLSGPEEVSTHALVDALLARADTEVYAPVIIGRGLMEARRLRNRAELRPGRYDIPAPLDGELPAAPIEAVLAPGLGFTKNGERIGLGAGFYDRWFAAHGAARRIALAYRCQMVEHIPTDANDLPVHVLVTADGSLRIG